MTLSCNLEPHPVYEQQYRTQLVSTWYGYQNDMYQKVHLIITTHILSQRLWPNIVLICKALCEKGFFSHHFPGRTAINALHAHFLASNKITPTRDLLQNSVHFTDWGDWASLLSEHKRLMPIKISKQRLKQFLLIKTIYTFS